MILPRLFNPIKILGLKKVARKIEKYHLEKALILRNLLKRQSVLRIRCL